jgi:ribonuclease HI
MADSPNPEAASPLKHVMIYTDGGANPNPGAGGYGVVLRFGEHVKELSGGFRWTTNNRMELMAVIVGLEALKEKCQVTLHSDSQYIVNAITSGAAFRWRSNGWGMNASGSRLAKNPDLWERLLAAFERHEVRMVWVKGHAGIPDNERCDVLAVKASQRSDLPPDEGYGEVEPPRRAHVKTPDAKSAKMETAGQACRKCGTPVIKRTRSKRQVKAQQTYYYAWYLHCPGCRTMYLVEEAKVILSDGTGHDTKPAQNQNAGRLFAEED